MHAIEAKEYLIFVVEELHQAPKETVHIQTIIPHQAIHLRDEVYKKLLEYAEHLDLALQLANTLYDIILKIASTREVCYWTDRMTPLIARGNYL